MSELTWVAKPNGKGWSSNRTRDLVDLAFTVNKEYAGYASEVTVRCTWYDGADARARRVIGRFYFDTHVLAKQFIETALKNAIIDPKSITKDLGRQVFLDEMLNYSLEEGSPGKKGSHYPYAVYGGKYIKKPEPTVAAAVTAVMDSAPTTIPTSFSISMEELFGTSTASEVVPEFMKTIESVEEVTKSFIEPVDISSLKPGDPAPAGYIWMGKELVKMSWPS
jgi:hypothetical protein